MRWTFFIFFIILINNQAFSEGRFEYSCQGNWEEEKVVTYVGYINQEEVDSIVDIKDMLSENDRIKVEVKQYPNSESSTLIVLDYRLVSPFEALTRKSLPPTNYFKLVGYRDYRMAYLVPAEIQGNWAKIEYISREQKKLSGWVFRDGELIDFKSKRDIFEKYLTIIKDVGLNLKKINYTTYTSPSEESPKVFHNESDFSSEDYIFNKTAYVKIVNIKRDGKESYVKLDIPSSYNGGPIDANSNIKKSDIVVSALEKLKGTWVKIGSEDHTQILNLNFHFDLSDREWELRKVRLKKEEEESAEINRKILEAVGK